jgi:hypothetical protein
MSKNYNVITSIKTKADNDVSYSEPTYLGAEQRFVGPLLNSNNNNLEEQLIIGADSITTEWDGVNPDTGKSTHYVVKRFYSGLPPKDGYFILFSDYPINIEFSQRLSNALIADKENQELIFNPYAKYLADEDENSDVAFNSNTLYFTAISGSTVSNHSLMMDNYNSSRSDYVYNAQTHSIEAIPKETPITTITVTRNDMLCFRTEVNSESDNKIDSDILISKKTTIVKKIDDKTQTTERIENFL